MTSPDIQRAATILRAGGVVAFPTETVYGLGGDAGRSETIARIFAVKGRPLDNPLIVHVADQTGLEAVAAEVSPLARRLAEHFWPGPLTLVVQATDAVRPATAGLDTVAVRVPDHPVAQALLLAAGIPVAAPSANRSGRPSPTTAAHVRADLGGDVDFVLDGGPCTVGVESTVVDARGVVPVVLRPGAVTAEELAAVAPSTANGAQPHRSPGTRHAHYQPSCRVEIAPPGMGAARAGELAAAGQRVAVLASTPADSGVHELGPFTGTADLARRLYGALREAERLAVDVIVVEAVAPEGIGRAVMDRLERAAGVGFPPPADA